MNVNLSSDMLSAYKTLNAFSDFAAGQKDDAVIHSNANVTDGKSFSVDENDGARGLHTFTFRTPAQRDVARNNQTRETFSKAVLTLFGADDLNDEKIPQNVRDVLRAGDYDNAGHPLSARRINKVVAAISEAVVYKQIEKIDAAKTELKGRIDSVETDAGVKSMALASMAQVQKSGLSSFAQSMYERVKDTQNGDISALCKKDVVRATCVQLNNGTTISPNGESDEELTDRFKDALAKEVSGDENATFRSLAESTNPEDRKKLKMAQFIAVNTCQTPITTFEAGMLTALSLKSIAVGKEGGDVKRSTFNYSHSINEDGSVTFTAKNKVPLRSVYDFASGHNFNCDDEKSHREISLTYTYTKDQVEAFLTQDWSTINSDNILMPKHTDAAIKFAVEGLSLQ